MQAGGRTNFARIEGPYEIHAGDWVRGYFFQVLSSALQVTLY